MFHQIKITIPFLLAAFLFSCDKAEVSNHSCCTKENSAQKTTNVNVNSDKNSLYQLPGTWVNQQNEEVQLDQLKGKIRLVAMVFTHCGYACPRMVHNMKAVEKALPANLRDKVGYVLVSFDPERDTPERLEEYAEQNHLDPKWTLLHGDEGQVRIFSMLLQLQYSQLPDGNFNHSNILTILDEQGAIVKQFEGLDTNTENVLETIGQLASK